MTLPPEGAAAGESAAAGHATSVRSHDGGLPLVSIVTTCKGRLDSLRRSLPKMAAQSGAEVIVVCVQLEAEAGLLDAEDRAEMLEGYGLREGAHVDPDGNLLRFGSPLRSGT